MKVFVYVIGREQGPVKVGISQNPEKRLGAIQSGCPFRVKVLHKSPARDLRHAYSHEQIFHEIYAPKRLVGEWFNLDADLAIEGVETGFQIEEYLETRDGVVP